MRGPKIPIGIRSLAVGFPSVLRTNDYWRTRYPAMVAEAEKYSLAKLWAKAEKPDAFDASAAAYMGDPFRGAVERRLRAPGETALSMELRAARGALEAASLGPDDIDLTIVTSFVGDRLGTGNAIYLAKELGLRTPAWNYETACSGSLVGLHTAASLVRSGDYRRILVVVSTSNSVQVTDVDTLGWFVGDGSGAFIVERVPEGYGLLGWKTINSLETIDMFVIQTVSTPQGGTRFCTAAHPEANRIARDTAQPYLKTTVEGALAMADMSMKDVDYWVFNTPNAWYADFCAQTLGVEQGRYHSMYTTYGNIGAALMPTTFYHDLHAKRIKPGDVVGMYSIGSTSTSSALVLRAGDIALGPYPTKPSTKDEVAISSIAIAPPTGDRQRALDATEASSQGG
ncbi:hypothetical protein LZC95_21855 [Pendulispora brunnea]|uniref:3-oxoacyl-ACP synthase n=1 Tax=Pendulispora brunnea TaxID=2905690 RepID=A0ABZ2KLB5_9BACT